MSDKYSKPYFYCICQNSGIPNLITADMIKEGAAVIDVGINRIQDPITGKKRLVGDVDFEGVVILGLKKIKIPDLLGVSCACNRTPFLSTFRCATEGGLHHPGTWRRGTHDCGNAYEEHHQSSKEHPAVSSRKDPHGSCILMDRP